MEARGARAGGVTSLSSTKELEFLLVSVCDAALGEVVGGQFESGAVAGEDSDAVAAETVGHVGEDGAVLLELDAEESAGELFGDGAGDFDAVFLAHSPSPWRNYTQIE